MKSKKKNSRVYRRVYAWPEDKERLLDLARLISKNQKDTLTYLLDVEELHRDDELKSMEERNKNRFFYQMKAILKKQSPEKYQEFFGQKKCSMEK
ncbi:MAG: hypothetical protein ACFFG0_06015 [Candidatus Thorarchaeota archaeon]